MLRRAAIVTQQTLHLFDLDAKPPACKVYPPPHPLHGPLHTKLRCSLEKKVRGHGYRAGFVQVDHGRLAHEADGHAEPALHAPAVRAHLLVAHPPVEQVDTAQGSVHGLMQLQPLHSHAKAS